MCGGGGWIRIPKSLYDRDFGKLRRCTCRVAEDCIEFQKRHGTRLQNVSISDIKDRGTDSRLMIYKARKFISEPRGFLTIWGSNGNGKTMTLMAIANHTIDRSRGTLYITGADLVNYIKAGIGLLFGPDERVNLVSEIPILCLDELAGAHMSEWIGEKIETIIDRRYQAGLGTVIAMDEDPALKLHNRVVSRLKTGPIVSIFESDMRPLIGGNE